MKFLILFALVAVASADYHDDTFHFSTLGSVSGLQKSSFVQTSAPVLTKKYTTVKSSPVYSSAAFVAQPAYSQQYAVNVKEIAQPVYSQQYVAKQVAQPAVFSQQYVAKPAVFAQQYVAKQVAQPVYSQYSAVKEIAQPVYSQQYAYKQVAQPIVSHVSTYAAGYSGPQYRILSQVQETDPSGPYRLAYSTENGIQASEEGHLIAGAEGGVIAAQGSYSYTGPDGVQYTVNYIADDNGFRAEGEHLPTPPPIPAEILKSLEENAASGEQYDEEGRLIH
ncbi:hypothetical protein ONE63_006544 [Megalurothrips usitatus]|uniref:Uncharacterized protein n=1 Tax=Megalurothrips usitatus TaxID=439358 RepID=A0AAV7XUC1_9NEOP|nr:hypothetical protein ONE63_006544 [Megalurothrips usitatus]